MENCDKTNSSIKILSSSSHYFRKKCLNFCTDFERSIVLSTFQRRGWNRVGPEDNWNIFWSNSPNCRSLFVGDNAYRLSNQQLVNHFSNNFQLGRKDLLIRNIKNYRRDLEKANNPLAEKKLITLPNGIQSYIYKHLDFIPTTFVLPSDYRRFVDEYNKYPQSTWIIKPCAKSQGAGICLINKLSKLKKWSRQYKCSLQHHMAGKDSYIISRYINNPLLIGGKKFDLRIYVLVTSFRPLKAYMFEKGFCRFCTLKYDTSVSHLENMFVHLTNVSVQKHGTEYNSLHGGKLGLDNLKLYLQGTRGHKVTARLFEAIQWLIVHSLKAVAPVMANDYHCFECYGYDIIIDDNLKPWLVEINSSPSLTGTTKNDRILKHKLIDSLLSVILPPNGVPDVRRSWTLPHKALENFTVLIQEDMMEKDRGQSPEQKKIQRGQSPEQKRIQRRQSRTKESLLK